MYLEDVSPDCHYYYYLTPCKLALGPFQVYQLQLVSQSLLDSIAFLVLWQLPIIFIFFRIIIIIISELNVMSGCCLPSLAYDCLHTANSGLMVAF